MRKTLLPFLQCPKCHGDLKLRADAMDGDRVRHGALHCEPCGASWPIKQFVPRFVSDTHYADSFGLQWKTFARTQLDGGESRESETRFKLETGWHSSSMKGAKVIEFGSGAGRFVDVVSRSGAEIVIGVDITDAVDAASENLGNRGNVEFVQADVFNLPIKSGRFDFAYSIGVLHHTPDPHLGFRKLVEMLKVGGSVALSLYEILLQDRPNRYTLRVATMDVLWAINVWRCALFRCITTRIPSALFLWYCRNVVPILHHLNKIPVLRYVRYLVPSTCYRHLPVEWSMVDTHDTYATEIVHQYRGRDVFRWFLMEGLDRIILHNSRPGWVSVTGKRPSEEMREALRLAEPPPPRLGAVAAE